MRLAASLPPPARVAARQVLRQFQRLRDPSWHIIDASAPPEKIAAQLAELAAAAVERAAQGAELGRLWGDSSSGGGSSGKSGEPLSSIGNVLGCANGGGK